MNTSIKQPVSLPAYVLVTPARDEAEHIERTLRSVVAQTILPQQWVIVSDNSTDQTDDIVRRFAKDYPFIHLLRLNGRQHRDFASKVYAQQAGKQAINGTAYDYFGFLDADISFEPDAFERLLTQFGQMPDLGIAGGAMYEPANGSFEPMPGNRTRTVGGPFQIFRRQCLEQIALIPLRYGGEDTLLEAMATMKGWQVRSFEQVKICHHKAPNSLRQKLKAGFHYGRRDYTCCTHPLYMLAKSLRRLVKKPYLLGALARIAGYSLAFLSRCPREIPEDVAAFIRKEQLARLKTPFSRKSSEAHTALQRVCIVAKYRYPMFSRLQQQARTLAEAGIAVDIICLQSENQPRIEHLGPITVYRVCRERDRDGFLKYLWFTGCFMTAAFFKLQHLLLKHHPAVLVVHTLPEYMVFLGILHKLFKKAIVLDTVDLSVEVFQSKWGQGKWAWLKPVVKCSEKASCWFSNHILTASPGFKERLIERGVKPDKITIMMNAADTKVFTFDQHRTFEPIKENAKIFYHGTVAARFGLAEAIEAIALVQNRIPGTTLQIYGRHYAQYRAILEKRIRELNLEEKVTLGGLQPHEKICELIRASDIGIVPYQNNDFMNIALSTKMFEYAASGIPIVASRLRSAESIFDDNCVSFSEPAAPADLADKIVQLCLYPQLRRQKVQAAFNANEKVAGPVMAKRFSNVIDNLLKGTTSR